MHKTIIFIAIVLLLVLSCQKRSVAPKPEATAEEMTPEQLYTTLENWALQAPDGGELAACVRDCWRNVYQPCCKRSGEDPDNPDWESVCLSLFLTCFSRCYDFNHGHSQAQRPFTIWDYLRWCDSMYPACPACKI